MLHLKLPGYYSVCKCKAIQSIKLQIFKKRDDINAANHHNLENGSRECFSAFSLSFYLKLMIDY